ncbi:thioredoxin family protein [Aureibacter tunicatorum]|uniref:Thiol-disulfide isomerase/thioredoxin n=1 Tax=Aureibacter tunicatorum TaxID=866807 RepID=A0AAE4BSG4_9BACT|nr:thioredoxin family protein [Aureibacter tunicatorum]MDR6239726.1 thiol-disulfide isomerase/thioredoxin [Aureibacter tunicatorum]BDD04202.1 thiol reductase thioredoxin [Aureibacter tunicatorum]
MAVIQATDSDFEQVLKDNDKVIVKFFAGWCGSCRLFAPKFKRLSNDDKYEGVSFIDINAEQNPESRKSAGVNNLPYFAIYKNGELIEGISSSKEDSVVELIEKLNS